MRELYTHSVLWRKIHTQCVVEENERVIHTQYVVEELTFF